MGKEVGVPRKEARGILSPKDRGEGGVPLELTLALPVIDRFLSLHRIYLHAPGLAVSIVHKDKKIFQKGFGRANTEEGSAMTENNLFWASSATKLITATAVMQLVEKGKIDFQGKVSDYLPWFYSEEDELVKDLRIHDLLSLSSPVFRDSDAIHGTDAEYPTREELIEKVQRGLYIPEVEPFPNNGFKYSNLAYAVAGELVATVAEKSYREYVEEHIFNPLEMKRSYIDISTVPEAEKMNLAVGYERYFPEEVRRPSREKQSPPETHAMASAFGLITNVDDLARFVGAMMLGDERLLQDETKKTMQLPFDNRVDTLAVNYSYGVQTWKVGKSQLFGHAGSLVGNATHIAWDLQSEIGMSLLANAAGVQVVELMEGVFTIINEFRVGLERKNKYMKRDEEIHALKLLDLSEYEGIYSGNFGEMQIVDVGGYCLFGFNIDKRKPSLSIFLPDPFEKGSFVIVKDSPYEAPGEKLTFTYDEEGKIKGLIKGREPYKKDYISIP